MMDYEDSDSITREDDEFLNEEVDDNLSTISNQKNNADDSSVWSIVPPSMDNEVAVQERAVGEELTILPVDSTDSMPSSFGKQKESESNENSIVLDINLDSSATPTTGNTDIKEEEQKLILDPNTVINDTVESTVVETKVAQGDQSHFLTFSQTIKNIDYQKALTKLKDWRIGFFVLWVVTFMLALYYARLSIKQSQELASLRQENMLLRSTISDLESAKFTERKGWFTQGSDMVKEWASSITDININEYYSTSDDNESTYLDIWPGDAIDTVKNISSNVAALFGDVIDDVSTSTKDAFESVSDTISSVGENLYSVEEVSNTVSTLGETMLDIWDSQKYAIILGAIYFKVYELFDS